ncbi:MAG TPA: hypothetical protein VNA57_00080 [Acidimicrobiales bacterium]|nr:hypothetical protein [Acidimicrobiales bacterium]
MDKRNRGKYSLNELEAFLAMEQFLNDFYTRTNGGIDLAVLLADMEIQPDGDTNDPAAWEDWLKCIKRIKPDTMD